ncbi:translation initiation factor IF-2-like [Lemur catta]|uniref:translation initiation factor IF-2-like n=1 Tax=Lemur catta TaxID=9447 RepID=UPI001E268E70|nr:translation initiation factor IF-2-like [Lemur catta]
MAAAAAMCCRLPGPCLGRDLPPPPPLPLPRGRGRSWGRGGAGGADAEEAAPAGRGPGLRRRRLGPGPDRDGPGEVPRPERAAPRGRRPPASGLLPPRPGPASARPERPPPGRSRAKGGGEEGPGESSRRSWGSGDKMAAPRGRRRPGRCLSDTAVWLSLAQGLPPPQTPRPQERIRAVPEAASARAGWSAGARCGRACEGAGLRRSPDLKMTLVMEKYC